jgi:DNA modification methylase
MKRHWTWSSELVCYATRGKHTFNFPDSGHALNVWTFTKHSDGSHPTQKPVEVCEHALAHSSQPGHRIVDLFLGSGSTLIACEKTSRRCFGMEIEPLYVDVILTRWATFTGRDPVREDGVKWSELKALDSGDAGG